MRKVCLFYSPMNIKQGRHIFLDKCAKGWGLFSSFCFPVADWLADKLRSRGKDYKIAYFSYGLNLYQNYEKYCSVSTSGTFARALNQLFCT